MPDGEVPWPVREWRIAAGVAALLGLAPIATIVGANLLADRARTEAARLDTAAAPRLASAKAAERDRATLASVLRRPTLGATIDAIARALPADTSLISAGRGGDGLLQIEVRTPDPDRLRAALRYEPALAMLRDSGQRRSDTGMIVSMSEVTP